MRHLCAVSLLCLFFLSFAFSQEYQRTEVFGGYSHLNVDTNNLTSRQNASGWETAFSVNLNKWYAVEGDVSGYYKSYSESVPMLGVLGVGVNNITVNVRDYAFAGGPRFNVRPLFFHALLGGDHLTGSTLGVSAFQNGLVAAFGGGIQPRLSRNWSFRAGGDYVLTRHNILDGPRFTQHNFRAGVGIVYSFGGVHEGAESARITTGPTRSGESATMSIPSLGVRVGIQENLPGPKIVAVEPDGVAALARLHVGEVITKLDGKPIKSPMELAAELSARTPGSRVQLGYLLPTSAMGYIPQETLVILGPATTQDKPQGAQ
jgi:hypothetical protein